MYINRYMKIIFIISIALIIFNGSNIDTDIRFGCIAWGIKPKKTN